MIYFFNKIKYYLFYYYNLNIFYGAEKFSAQPRRDPKSYKVNVNFYLFLILRN